MKRFFLPILMICLISIFPISCGTAKYDEGYGAGFQEGYDKGYQEGFQAGEEEAAATVTSLPQITESTDKSPYYTAEEICASIWNRLPSELPDEYEMEQFDIGKRTAEYLGNSKWSFKVSGSGEDRIIMPGYIEEKSDVLWIERTKEIVTKYELELQAVYYEKNGMLEITRIEKSNEQAQVKMTSETPRHAKLMVMWYESEQAGQSCYLEGQVKNIGSIPLDNVTIEVKVEDLWTDEIIRVIQAPVYTDIFFGEQMPGLIRPSELAKFSITFTERRDVYFGSFDFFSSSGETIRFQYDEEFEKKLLGL